MEQTIKRTIPSRTADKLKGVKLNLWLSSNCLHSTSGKFSEIASKHNGLLKKQKTHCFLNNALVKNII